MVTGGSKAMLLSKPPILDYRETKPQIEIGKESRGGRISTKLVVRASKERLSRGPEGIKGLPVGERI